MENMERTIIITTRLRPLDQDELEFRRKALQDAVMFIGWLKLVSVICFAALYFLLLINSKEKPMEKSIQYMLLAIMPLMILNGLLLFFGAMEERIWALEVGFWMCLAIAGYNACLGIIGGTHFIQTGNLTIHFLFALIFFFMTVSLTTVVCHDALLIHEFKKHLRDSVT